MLIAGMSVLLLIALMVTGAIIVKRRRPILVDDGKLDRKNTIALVAVLVVLAMLSTLNTLPPRLYGYDTAGSWGNFLTTIVLGFLGAIPLALIFVGLWLTLDAMRRRAGIPMLEGPPSRSTSNTMLIAGLGLGGILYAMTRLDALIPRAGIPRVPVTSLNDLAPAFAGITDIPMASMMMVAIVGIPLLTIAALSPRGGMRALMAALILGLVAVMGLSGPSANDIDPVGIALVVAGAVVAGIALLVGGARSAWSWIVAVLYYQSLAGLRNAAYGPVWQERIGGLLTLIVTAGLVALVALRATREPAEPLTRV
jgi:tetrahydromethanopterin S-methyltransferase subunit B